MERRAHYGRNSAPQSTSSREQQRALEMNPLEETHEEDFPPIGFCIVYNPIKKTVGVPLPNNRRIDITDRTDCLYNLESVFAEDYMKGFAEFVRIAALGTPDAPRKRRSDPSSEPDSAEADVKTSPPINPTITAAADANKQSADKIPVTHPHPTNQLDVRITDCVEQRQLLPGITAVADSDSPSAESAQQGSSVQQNFLTKSVGVPLPASPADKARWKSMLATRAADRALSLPATARPAKTRQKRLTFDCDDVRFRKLDEQVASAVPVRQSERRISRLLLNNEALDVNLGIGIGDDENQRRAWHKPRSKVKEIMSHRAANGKLFFLVRQPAGNSEWLEDWQVEEQLKEKYKADYLEPGESLERPPKRKKKEKDWFESSWEKYLQQYSLQFSQNR